MAPRWPDSGPAAPFAPEWPVEPAVASPPAAPEPWAPGAGSWPPPGRPLWPDAEVPGPSGDSAATLAAQAASLDVGAINDLVALLRRWYRPAATMQTGMVVLGANLAGIAFEADPNRIGAAITIPSGANVYMGGVSTVSPTDSAQGVKGLLLPASGAPYTWVFGPEYTGPIFLVSASAVTLRTLALIGGA